jgi:hypothetical protein
MAVLPVSLTDSQKGMIQKAEQKLSSIKSLRARFEQISNTGAAAAGTVAIKRPGRMRLDYCFVRKIRPPTTRYARNSSSGSSCRRTRSSSRILPSPPDRPPATRWRPATRLPSAQPVGAISRSR